MARGSRAVFLLHAGEIFYELPTENAGGFRYVHPVAATARQIVDYDTWKGCLVMKEADADATIVLEADIDGNGTWVAAGAYPVKANAPRTVKLPSAFSAYWVRVRANRACTATAQFVYE